MRGLDGAAPRLHCHSSGECLVLSLLIDLWIIADFETNGARMNADENKAMSVSMYEYRSALWSHQICSEKYANMTARLRSEVPSR